jgi:hypothetical protein
MLHQRRDYVIMHSLSFPPPRPDAVIYADSEGLLGRGQRIDPLDTRWGTVGNSNPQDLACFVCRRPGVGYVREKLYLFLIRVGA